LSNYRTFLIVRSFVYKIKFVAVSQNISFKILPENHLNVLLLGGGVKTIFFALKPTFFKREKIREKNNLHFITHLELSDRLFEAD
jgi:hypothetical protein